MDNRNLKDMIMKLNRRELLAGIGGLSGTLILNGCFNQNKSPLQQTENVQAIEVTAVEDLMREDGVVRRALLVYSEAAVRLRTNPSQINIAALQRTARLFRTFGEDYHEKKLEETYIFPAVKEAGGPAAKLPDILLAQHNRGRQITDYILTVTQGKNFEPDSIEPLAQTLESLVRMYRGARCTGRYDYFPRLETDSFG